MEKYTMEEMKEMGVLKTLINVSIRAEQVVAIKKLVGTKEYPSINSFVKKAVEEKLNKK